MTDADLREILGRVTVRPDGTLRAVASEWLPGVPAGVFNYHGRRRDDPNDRVDHEHRRELRGLRVVSSWMNDADRRAANTLVMYVTGEDGGRHLKHYLHDMGSTFGSNNVLPHQPKYGNEYLWDPRTIGKSLLSLGFYRKPWSRPLAMAYPELGYFGNETFDPKQWVPTYPNLAFERCTGRDGFWGAKIVVSFTDEEIATIVSTGGYSNPAAAAELTRLLIERRDAIGRYWYGRVNPLDRFRVDAGGLRFTDMAISGGLAQEEDTAYRYRLIDGRARPMGAYRSHPPGSRIPIPPHLHREAFHGFEIQTRRAEGAWSPPARVFFYIHQPGQCQIVRVEREDGS